MVWVENVTRWFCEFEKLKSKIYVHCTGCKESYSIQRDFFLPSVCWSHELWIFSLSYSFFWLLMPINTYGIASHKRGHNPFLEVYWAFRCDLAILGTNSDTYCEKKAWHVFFILCLSLCPYYIVVPLQAFLVVIKSDVLNILKILKRVRFKNSFVFHGHYYKATV